MPFITEEIYQQLNELTPRFVQRSLDEAGSGGVVGGLAKTKKSIMIEPWPISEK